MCWSITISSVRALSMDGYALTRFGCGRMLNRRPKRHGHVTTTLSALSIYVLVGELTSSVAPFDRRSPQKPMTAGCVRLKTDNALVTMHQGRKHTKRLQFTNPRRILCPYAAFVRRDCVDSQAGCRFAGRTGVNGEPWVNASIRIIR